MQAHLNSIVPVRLPIQSRSIFNKIKEANPYG
nr:MAG TPA: hypothetical protein [Caudoviricetes sp.]